MKTAGDCLHIGGYENNPIRLETEALELESREPTPPVDTPACLPACMLVDAPPPHTLVTGKPAGLVRVRSLTAVCVASYRMVGTLPRVFPLASTIWTTMCSDLISNHTSIESLY